MALTWHILRKDLRRLRWLLLAWLLLVALGPIAMVYAPLAVVRDGTDTAIVTLLSMFGSMATALLSVVITSVLVHDEPLVGSEAFWLTRPIPRTTLFASKAVLLLACIVLPSVIADETLLAMMHVPTRLLWIGAPELLLTTAAVMTLLFFLTAVTPRVLHSGVLLLCCMALVIAALFAAIAIGTPTHFTHIRRPRLEGSETAWIVGLGLFVAGLLAAIRFAYDRRLLEIATMWAAATVLVAVVIGTSWPHTWVLFGEAAIVDEPWARDPRMSTLVVEPDPLRIANASYVDEIRDGKAILAPVRLAGLPANYSGCATTLESTFRLADDTVVRGQRSRAMYTHAHRRTPRPGLEVDCSGANRVDTNPPGPLELWPVLLDISPEDFARVEGQTGAYHGTFEYEITHREDLGVFPVHAGAIYTADEKSLTILETAQTDHGCEVILRNADTRLNLARGNLSWLTYTFRQRSSGLELDRERLREWDSHRMEVPPLRIGGLVSSPILIEYRQSAPHVPNSTPGIWQGTACDDLDIAIESFRFAGFMVRTLDIPSLRIEDPREARLWH